MVSLNIFGGASRCLERFETADMRRLVKRRHADLVTVKTVNAASQVPNLMKYFEHGRLESVSALPCGRNILTANMIQFPWKNKSLN